MNKVIYNIFRVLVIAITLCISLSVSGYAQTSKLEVTGIQLIVDKKDTVAYEQMLQKGLGSFDTLTVRLYFLPQSMDYIVGKEVPFEFQLLRKLSTKWLPDNNRLIKITYNKPEGTPKVKNNYVEMKYTGLKSGFWKFQVFSYFDQSYLTYKNVKEFILIIN